MKVFKEKMERKKYLYSFSSLSEFVKENTTLLILIPTIIGGAIQLYNLYIIDPYLVRFFSITQLISDGLWILFIFLPLYFLIPLAILFLSPVKHLMFRGTKEDENGIIFFNFIIILGYIGSIYLIIIEKKKTYWLLWFLIASCLMGIAQNREALKVFQNQKIYQSWKTFFYIALLPTTLAFMYCLTLDKSMPKNIANLQVIDSKVQASFPNYQHNLLYMNDKYLFS